MNNLLLIIDLQKDFINDKTRNVPYNIEKLISRKKYKYIIFTKFINDINSPFYKELKDNGCTKEEGKKITIDTLEYPILNKKAYTALNNELKLFLKDKDIETIYLCGIDTDACILKTAIDSFENNFDVKVIEDCCMSHSGKKYHNFAINMLKKIIGKQNVISKLGSVKDD